MCDVCGTASWSPLPAWREPESPNQEWVPSAGCCGGRGKGKECGATRKAAGKGHGAQKMLPCSR